MAGNVLGDPRMASALAYAAWWVSGAIVWLAERDRPAVRFHAMQSILAFGAISLLWALLWLGSFGVLVVSAAGFFVMQRLAQAVVVLGALLWAYCLWRAAAGQQLRLPWAGRLAARAAAGSARPPATA